MASDQNSRASSASLGLPILIFAILAVAIFAGTGLFLGYVDKRPLAMPSAIGAAPSANANETAGGTPSVVRFTRPVSVVDPTTGGVARLASLASARLVVNGTVVCSTAGGSGASKAEGRMPALSSGSHTIVIESDCIAPNCVVLACIELEPSGERVVTDASWNASSSFATIVGGYESAPIGPIFGPLDAYSMSPKGARFWVPLLCLVLAMAVASFAGPILRPSDRSRADTSIVDLAAVIPSIVYASAACVITSTAAFGAGPSAIGGLHVLAAAVFALTLVVWKKGAAFIEQDQVAHRAELSGYDSLQTHFEVLQSTVGSRSAAFRSATDRVLQELGEAIRFASTSTATSELDARIVAALGDLEARVAASDEMPEADFAALARDIVNLLRRREVFAQAARRS
jgi:hypothetical protein